MENRPDPEEARRQFEAIRAELEKKTPEEAEAMLREARESGTPSEEQKKKKKELFTTPEVVRRIASGEVPPVIEKISEAIPEEKKPTESEFGGLLMEKMGLEPRPTPSPEPLGPEPKEKKEMVEVQKEGEKESTVVTKEEAIDQVTPSVPSPEFIDEKEKEARIIELKVRREDLRQKYNQGDAWVKKNTIDEIRDINRNLAILDGRIEPTLPSDTEVLQKGGRYDIPPEIASEEELVALYDEFRNTPEGVPYSITAGQLMNMGEAAERRKRIENMEEGVLKIQQMARDGEIDSKYENLELADDLYHSLGPIYQQDPTRLLWNYSEISKRVEEIDTFEIPSSWIAGSEDYDPNNNIALGELIDEIGVLEAFYAGSPKIPKETSIWQDIKGFLRYSPRLTIECEKSKHEKGKKLSKKRGELFQVWKGNSTIQGIQEDLYGAVVAGLVTTPEEARDFVGLNELNLRPEQEAAAEGLIADMFTQEPPRDIVAQESLAYTQNLLDAGFNFDESGILEAIVLPQQEPWMGAGDLFLMSSEEKRRRIDEFLNLPESGSLLAKGIRKGITNLFINLATNRADNMILNYPQMPVPRGWSGQTIYGPVSQLGRYMNNMPYMMGEISNLNSWAYSDIAIPMMDFAQTNSMVNPYFSSWEFQPSRMPLAVPVSQGMTAPLIQEEPLPDEIPPLTEERAEEIYREIREYTDLPEEERARAEHPISTRMELAQYTKFRNDERKKDILELERNMEEGYNWEFGWTDMVRAGAGGMLYHPTKIMEKYIEKVNRPVSSRATYVALKLWPGDQHMEKLINQGVSVQQAYNECYGDNAVGLALDMVFDPLWLVPGFGPMKNFVTAGVTASKMARLGKPVAQAIPLKISPKIGEPLISCLSTAEYITDLPMRGFWWAKGKIPKAPTQLIRRDSGTINNHLVTLAERECIKPIAESPSGYIAQIVTAAGEQAGRPGIFGDLGNLLRIPKAVDFNEVDTLSKALGKAEYKATSSDVSAIEYAVRDYMGMASPELAGRQILEKLGIDYNAETLGKVVGWLDKRVLDSSNWALKIAENAPDAATAIRNIVNQSEKIRFTHINSPYMKEYGVTAMRMANNLGAYGVRPFGRVHSLVNQSSAFSDLMYQKVWTNKINRVVGPIQHYMLGFAMYGPWNVAEMYMRPLLRGTFPHAMDRRGLTLTLGDMAAKIEDPSLFNVLDDLSEAERMMFSKVIGKGEGQMYVLPDKIPGYLLEETEKISPRLAAILKKGEKMPYYLSFEFLADVGSKTSTKIRLGVLGSTFKNERLSLAARSAQGREIVDDISNLVMEAPEFNYQKASNQFQHDIADAISTGNRDYVQMALRDANRDFWDKEALHIAADMIESPAYVKSFADITIENGDMILHTDEIIDSLKHLASKEIAYRNTATKPLAKFAESVEAVDIKNPNELVNTIRQYTRAAEIGDNVPHHIYSRYMDKANEEFLRGAPRERVEALMKEGLKVSDIAQKEIETIHGRMAKLINNKVKEFKKIKPLTKELAPEHEVLIRQILNDMQTRKHLATETRSRVHRIWDDYNAMPSELRTHEALKNVRYAVNDEWKLYGEALEKSTSNILKAEDLAMLYKGFDLPRVKVDATSRELSLEDVAVVVGGDRSTICQALVDDISIMNRNSFVSLVQGFAEKTGAKGFTPDKIGKVYDRLVKELGLDPSNIALSRVNKGLDSLAVEAKRIASVGTVDLDDALRLENYVNTRVYPEMDRIFTHENKTYWDDISGQALKKAHDNYRFAFADYSQDNLLDMWAKVVYPYWTYSSQRLPYLLGTAIKAPPFMIHLLEYRELTEEGRGYIHIPWLDMDINPFRGMAYGTIFGLWSDFPSPFEVSTDDIFAQGFEGFLEGMRDYAGLYPNVLFNLGEMFLGGRMDKVGELLPPGVDALVSMGALTNAPFMTDLRQTLDGPFIKQKIGIQATILAKKKGLEIPAADFIDNERNNTLSEQEREIWKEAERDFWAWNLLGRQTGMARFAPDEWKRAVREEERWWEENYGFTPEEQHWATSMRKRLSDMVPGGLTPAKKDELSMLEYNKYFSGTGFIFGPPSKGMIDRARNKVFQSLDRLDEVTVEKEKENNRKLLNHEIRISQWFDRDSEISDEKNKMSEQIWAEHPNVPRLLDEIEEYYKERGLTPPIRNPLQDIMDMFWSIQPVTRIDPVTGYEYEDFSEFYNARDVILDAFGEDPETRDELLESLGRKWTPLRREVWKFEQEHVNPYWRVKDQTLEMFPENEQNLIKQIESGQLSEADLATAKATITPNSRALAMQLYQLGEYENPPAEESMRLYNVYSKWVTLRRKIMKVNDPWLDAYMGLRYGEPTFQTPMASDIYEQIRGNHELMHDIGSVVPRVWIPYRQLPIYEQFRNLPTGMLPEGTIPQQGWYTYWPTPPKGQAPPNIYR